MNRLEHLGPEAAEDTGGAQLSRARRLRARCMATLLSTGLIAACGGNVADEPGSGGAAGGAGSSNSGGSGAVGGNGAVGGGANTGGSRAVGGSSAVGGAGAMGGASTGGSGGGPSFRIEGEVVCDFCGTWTTCFAAQGAPAGDGAELDANGCPYWLDSTRTPAVCDGGFIDYFPLEVQQPGECCYNSMFQCGGGRPFLVAGAPRVAHSATRKDWHARQRCGDRALQRRSAAWSLSPVQAAALSGAWLGDALMEHASVAAFARFSLELLGFGAPADLVRDAQLAALDEVRHAQACFALASRFGGKDLGPGALQLDDATPRRSLEEFARCTFLEGCIGETFATLVAETGAQRSNDAQVCGVLGQIAEDEARHAELAWRTLGWVMAKLSAARRQGLVADLQSQLMLEIALCRTEEKEASQGLGRIEPQLAAYGRVDRRHMLELRLSALEQVVAPCLASLASGRELRAA